MSLLSERNRKTTLLVLCLVFLLIAGIGFTAFYYQEAQTTSSQLTETTWQLLILNSTVQQVKETAPYTTFNLTYTPSPMLNTTSETVTFMFGYIEASALDELYYPSTLLMSFKVSHRTNGTARVTYDYTPMQSVQLVKGIQTVYAPFGIFPLQITKAQPGEVITFYITINAIVNWTPVNTVIASKNITAITQLQVVA